MDAPGTPGSPATRRGRSRDETPTSLRWVEEGSLCPGDQKFRTNMERSTQIGVGVILLVLSSFVVFYASVSPTSSLLLAAIVVASLGLAAGALLVGASGTSGRIV